MLFPGYTSRRSAHTDIEGREYFRAMLAYANERLYYIKCLCVLEISYIV